MLDPDELNRRFHVILEVIKNPLQSDGPLSAEFRTGSILAERIHDYIDYAKQFEAIGLLQHDAANNLKAFESLQKIAMTDLDIILLEIMKRIEDNGLSSNNFTQIFNNFNRYKSNEIYDREWRHSPIGDGWENKQALELMFSCIIDICRELVGTGQQILIQDYLEFKNEEAKMRNEGDVKVPMTYSIALAELKRFRESLLGRRYRAWQLLDDVYQLVTIGHKFLYEYAQYFFNEAHIYSFKLTTIHNFLLLPPFQGIKDISDAEELVLWSDGKNKISFSSGYLRFNSYNVRALMKNKIPIRIFDVGRKQKSLYLSAEVLHTKFKEEYGHCLQTIQKNRNGILNAFKKHANSQNTQLPETFCEKFLSTENGGLYLGQEN